MTINDRSLIADIERAIDNASGGRQSLWARRLTDLFLEGGPHYSKDQIAVFDNVLERLVEHCDHSTWVELSERLAPVPHAPPNVIGRLASDNDITVSGPTLRQSASLADATLIEVARSKAQSHLLAIAGRAQVNSDVTDIIVSRGSDEVIRSVAGNSGAVFSELSFAKLINRGKADASLAQVLAARKDVPAELRPFLDMALAKA